MTEHELDCSHIDDLDELDDDCQLALVWCNTHDKFEWHNLPTALIGTEATIKRMKRDGWNGSI